MTTIAKLLLGTSVTVGAAGAASATWIALGHGPTRAAGVSKPGNSPSSQTVVICAASDGVTKAVNAAACPAGQTLLNVDCVGCGESPSQSPDARHQKEELADLKRRVDQLRQSSLFTVVDKNGERIFSVGDDHVGVYAPSDAVPRDAKTRAPATRTASSNPEVAWIGGEDDAFAARSSDGRFVTRLAVSESQPRFWIEENGLTRLQMGKSAAGISGQYSLKVPAIGGKGLIAGIGESPGHTGIVMLGDLAGRSKVMMTGGDRGAVTVFNTSGAPVVELSEATSGGGLLTIGSADSTTMVKMGVKDDRYGAVLTGPKAGFPFVPRSGLPGSYFLGCAGGSSCTP